MREGVWTDVLLRSFLYILIMYVNYRYEYVFKYTHMYIWQIFSLSILPFNFIMSSDT